VAVVVVDHAQLGVVVFAAPPDGLGDVAAGALLPVEGIGISGSDTAGVAEDFRHVFGQVDAAGVPRTASFAGNEDCFHKNRIIKYRAVAYSIRHCTV